MSTSKGYLDFILEQLSELDGITYKQMMGEYIIYFNGRIAAYLCDDRLLIKPVASAVRMMPNARLEPPYDGAKDMLLCENVDDKAFLKELFEAIYPELPEPKKKKAK
ncbi:MAG: TfoX/Sxy family protein [Oscillospiraceae bacterium]